MGDFPAIDRFAARQHGVFNNAQLRSAGFDKSSVRRLVASSRWVRLDYRVFGMASAPATWERQLWSAILSREQAIVGGKSAAFLHRLRGISKGRPVIVVPGSANARSEVARIIRAEHYEELTIESVEGFPVTSVAETLVCLAAELGPTHLETVFEDALLANKLNLSAVSAVLEREANRRRRGIIRVRQLVEDRDSSTPSIESSYLEGILEQVLGRGDLPTLTREFPFVLTGRDSRVDVYIPLWKLVIEADGRTWHARTEAFETDRSRDNELASQGIQVLRFTYRMLKSEPEACFRTIAETGRVRRAGGVVDRTLLL